MVLAMNFKSKYYNIKTKTSDGKVFDSVKEARRWEQLLLLQKAGRIVELQRQVEYELMPAQYESYERYTKKGVRLKEGRRLIERKVKYVADFVYRDAETGELIVEDTKGVKTKDYIIKRKLLLAVHGIKIKEI
jgi:hypothetical protein